MTEVHAQRLASDMDTSPSRVRVRAPNEIDFWRGFALVSIFVNHIPGVWFEAWTHKNLGFSDSAEIFVFLAGFSLRFLAEAKDDRASFIRIFLKLETRAFKLYASQIFITVLALAMLAQTALYFDTPLILQWNNAQAFFQEPVTTIIGIAALSYQLGYFDILPLYVVLMVFAPVIVALHRAMPVALLPISLALWLLALIQQINLSTWPVEGRWFFNPLAWQFDFVLGFLLARPTGMGAWARKSLPILRIAGAIVLVLAFAVRQYGWDTGLSSLLDYAAPHVPHLFLALDKTFLSPARLLHLLALAAVFAGYFARLQTLRPFNPVARFLSMFGRNSLQVFCAGSLLSLIGQIVRFAMPISFVTDFSVIVGGLMILSLVAWLNEWRLRF